MIYIKLIGGLGNQMFQLATAKALALDQKTKVGLDISHFNNKESEEYTHRFFELDQTFDLNSIKLIDEKSYNYLFKKDFYSKIKRVIRNGSVLFETNLGFQPGIKGLTNEAYIEGYFQSEKYFQNHRSKLLKLFTFCQELSNKTLNAENIITNTNSIAVHIRRGDYASKKNVNQTHGILPISYYTNALNTFNLKDQHVFFFSDDIKWVKENISSLDIPKTSFINWNSNKDSWQDMYLMSKCKHFVIANSSFSWWGAWLSENKSKKIIAPKNWFADKKLNELTRDLIPENWIRI